MTTRDFTYWLRGFFEIQDPKSINEEQTKMIKEHLDKVFTNNQSYINFDTFGQQIGNGIVFTKEPIIKPFKNEEKTEDFSSYPKVEFKEPYISC